MTWKDAPEFSVSRVSVLQMSTMILGAAEALLFANALDCAKDKCTSQGLQSAWSLHHGRTQVWDEEEMQHPDSL